MPHRLQPSLVRPRGRVGPDFLLCRSRRRRCLKGQLARPSSGCRRRPAAPLPFSAIQVFQLQQHVRVNCRRSTRNFNSDCFTPLRRRPVAPAERARIGRSPCRPIWVVQRTQPAPISCVLTVGLLAGPRSLGGQRPRSGRRRSGDDAAVDAVQRARISSARLHHLPTVIHVGSQRIARCIRIDASARAPWQTPLRQAGAASDACQLVHVAPWLTWRSMFTTVGP